MASEQPIIEEGWKFERAVESAIALEQLLTRHGISVAPGSEFEARVLDVLRVPDLQAENGLVPGDLDVRELFRNVVGVHELARLILAAESRTDFTRLIPHLRLLADASGTQNSRSSARDDATNKLFELFIALLALECGDSLELDSPEESTGKNPDVLFTVQGKRWGIACKAVHGQSAKGLLDLLASGINQIERSEAEIGVVVFNLKNILPHDHIWPLEKRPVVTPTGVQILDVPKAFSPPDAPYHILNDWVRTFAQAIIREGSNGYLPGLFKGKKALPVLLFWCHSVSGITVAGGSKPASVRMMGAFTVGPIDASHRLVLECLNWAAYSDSPTRGPRPAV